MMSVKYFVVLAFLVSLCQSRQISSDGILDVLQVQPHQIQKRDLQPKDLDLGLGSIVSGLLSGVLNSVAIQPIVSVINSLLETVKTIAQGLLIQVAPENPLIAGLAGVLNTIIKTVLELLTNLQQTLSGLGSSSATNEDGKALLENVVDPVVNALSIITAPLNALVKSIVQILQSLLNVLVGPVITVPLANFINALVDLLLPTRATL